VADPIEERDKYNELIQVAEDALEKAAEVVRISELQRRGAQPSTKPDRRLYSALRPSEFHR